MSESSKAAPNSPMSHPLRNSFAKKQWRTAALMTKDLPDPWSGLGFEEIEEESVTRHMYNSRNGKWKTDKVIVKIQSKVQHDHYPFFFTIITFLISHLHTEP